MRIKAIHTINGGDVLIETTDGRAIAVKRHTDSYSSARYVSVIPDDGRHTVLPAAIPKQRKGTPMVGGIAF